MPLSQLAEQLERCGCNVAAVWEVNRALVFTEQYGPDASQARVGKSLEELWSATPYGDRIIAAHRLALSGQPTGYDTEYEGRWYRVQLTPRWDGEEIVGVVGRAFPLPPTVQGEAPDTTAAPEIEGVEIIGELREDVPLADAVAGDRVIFRPDHPDPSRQCVVLHTSEGSLFADVIQRGALDILTARPGAIARDARRLLLRRLGRPLARLSLLK